MLHSAVSTILIFSTISLSGLGSIPVKEPKLLAQHSMSLENRQPDKWVNEVFKENILLNLSYLSGNVKDKKDINWEQIKKPFTYEFRLNKGETFAFHEDVLSGYNRVVRTTNAHFSSSEGFKSDGYLVGDGVCHLASIIYWVAKDANLDAKAPTNHNFAVINEVPKEYGVAIYNDGLKGLVNQNQNLYITNNKEKPVSFKFDYNGTELKVSVLEDN